MPRLTEPHECVFPEVVIEETDETGILTAGMRVLAPCSCGENPLDNYELLKREHAEISSALAAVEPTRLLFHWSPVARRKQIIRYGLRPAMRSTTSGEGGYFAPVCFADSPSWAWALSAGMRWTPPGAWDLWQTSLDRLHEPLILGTTDRASGVYEVRSLTRVYKRDLWHAGTRQKE